MRVCCCSLAGTRACNYCSNGGNSYYHDSMSDLIKDWNEHYKDKRRVVTYTKTITTTHLKNKDKHD